MENFVQPGDTINFTAPAGGAVAGNIYKGQNGGGVFKETAASGVSVAVALNGVFTVPKKAGANLDFVAYEKVFILTTGTAPNNQKAVPVTGGSTVSLGFAVAAAATGATSVQVRLSPF